jgi:hypothetical protein
MKWARRQKRAPGQGIQMRGNRKISKFLKKNDNRGFFDIPLGLSTRRSGNLNLHTQTSRFSA